MTSPTGSPHASTLQCDAAKRFQTRPSLYDVASRMLQDQWQTRHLNTTLDPASLYVVSYDRVNAQPCMRPLSQLLLERFCCHEPINLTPSQDTIVQVQVGVADKILSVELHPLETLINEAGPFLLDEYRRSLTTYWTDADKSGKSPWQWCSAYLRTRYEQALETHRRENTLDDRALAVARLLLGSAPGGMGTAVTVHSVRMDLLRNWQLDPDLASALLIESPTSIDKPAVTLLFTSSGRLIEYQSRTAVLARSKQRWPAGLPSASTLLRFEAISEHPFDVQARGILLQQLHATQLVNTLPDQRMSPMELELAIDRITAMLGMCAIDETDIHDRLVAQLPDWLRQASADQLLSYSLMLTGVAQTYREAREKTWLDGIEDAQTFANRRLAQCIRTDHPEFNLDPDQLRVANHQITAVAVPGGDAVVTSGDIQIARFSLKQLAIANVGLLQPGTVTVESADGSDVPEWFDESYLRSLIDRADIGKTYPTMLRTQLLDDATEKQRRTRLLGKQLRSQLPVLIMGLGLRGIAGAERIAKEIGEVFAPLPGQSLGWHMCPLGILSALDAKPDLPRNAWLFERTSSGEGPCLLYRPLLAEPLMQFSDRQALLEAISSPGDLQADILERLPAQTRKVYANGGFREPHLFYPGEDDWAVSFGRPAPASLSAPAPVPDPAAALYQACVEETIAQFSAHAQSSDQARWARWKTLGWLLLDSVLPLAPEPLASAGWMVQMESAFLQLATQPPQSPSERTAALLELLTNLALLLFTHARRKIDLERPVVPPAVDPLADAAASELPILVTAPSEPLLDLSWSNPFFKLEPARRQALLAMSMHLAPEQLGSAIPKGPLRGLYLYENKTCLVLDGRVYEVQLDSDGQRARIFNPKQPDQPGPWIQQNQSGRWTLDLRMRLHGGMPLQSRIAKLKAENAKALKELDEVLRQDAIDGPIHLATLKTQAQQTSAEASEADIQRYLDAAEASSTFWNQHLQRLKQRNERQVLPRYKILKAYGLMQYIRCEQAVLFNLRRLHDPLRKQVVQLHGRQKAGYELTEGDAEAVTNRIDRMLPLLDKLMEHGRTLTEQREQLDRLKSEHQPQISSYIDLVKAGWSNPSSTLVLRWMRIEACTNRLTLLRQLDDESAYWLERSWNNLQLAITQRLELKKLQSPGEEVAGRVLHSIMAQIRSARRQLNNLAEHLGPDHGFDEMTRMADDYDAFLSDISLDANSLPERTPTSTVQQLRKQLPGLIETQDHGILLGKAREDDLNIVDIPAPGGDSPTHSFILKEDRWVALEPPQPAPAAPAPMPKLKRLLKQSQARRAAARKDLLSLEKVSTSSYLPVEIEEILDGHRERIEQAREAIERRLTADNATDEAAVSGDAALEVKALEDLFAQLSVNAVRLRTAAALTGKPRMGELQFLLQHQQVTIRAVGSRTAMAKAKGRPADFLDEYAIQQGDTVIWYAHFHYRSMQAPRPDFVAGHLKLASQRFAQGQALTNSQNGTTQEVYRSPIALADAEQYFFTT